MSEIQTHIGKLSRIYVPYTLKKFEEWIEEYKNINLSEKRLHKNYTIYYDYNGNPKFIIFNVDKAFEVIDQTFEDGIGDINYFKRINKNQYDYVFQYYDGGTCFREVLEECLENLNFK